MTENTDLIKRLEDAMETFKKCGIPYNRAVAIGTLKGLKIKSKYSANPGFRGKVKGFEDSRKNK